MHTKSAGNSQTIRLFLYSSMAIVAMTLVWGVRQVPKQSELGESALRASLEQEVTMLQSSVRSATSALKYRLLDILKAEGNDRPTRTFQDSPFIAATLIEWDQNQWKTSWHSTKFKDSFQAGDVKTWVREWPLAKMAPDEAYFTRVAEVQGQAYFAIVVPVRKPNGVPMMGIGVFPAQAFGLVFSADRSREVRVFDDKGYALALTHPAYVGSSLKREPIVMRLLEGEELNSRLEWIGERAVPMLASGTRVADTNLYAAVETPMTIALGSRMQGWLYLILCALGATALNWTLFASLVQPLLKQLAQTEELNEQLKRQLSEKPQVIAAPLIIPDPELPNASFIEPVAETQTAPGTMTVSLGKVVHSALRSLDGRVREHAIEVEQNGLDSIQLEGDVLQLQTALEEVLKNAIEAVQNQPVRRLSVHAQSNSSGQVQLIVEDTGPGIPEENMAKVFDPFFSTKDSEGVARGLGLNVVRRVMEELNGDVKLSKREGGGTRVELIWPVAGANATPSKPVEVKAPLAMNDLDFLMDDDDEDFAAQPVSASGKRDLPRVDVRRPVVRTLD